MALHPRMYPNPLAGSLTGSLAGSLTGSLSYPNATCKDSVSFAASRGCNSTALARGRPVARPQQWAGGAATFTPSGSRSGLRPSAAWDDLLSGSQPIPSTPTIDSGAPTIGAAVAAVGKAVYNSGRGSSAGMSSSVSRSPAGYVSADAAEWRQSTAAEHLRGPHSQAQEQ